MNLFYHLIILDASGSMSCIRRQALSGCNETIQTIRSLQTKDPENSCHYLSLVSFNSDDRSRRIYDNIVITAAADLVERDYEPNGCTPLYDCVGLSICHLQDDIKRMKRETPDAHAEVLVTIITDGLENSSTLFDAHKVKSLVEECKAQGWAFAYIGANQDEILEAEKMGIHNAMSFEQDEEGTKEMFEGLHEMCCCFCESAPSMSIEDKDTRLRDFFRKKK